jgi:hypothetical protein
LGWESARHKAGTYTGQHKHGINKGRSLCLEWDLNPPNPVSVQAKTLHAVDRAATVIGGIKRGFLKYTCYVIHRSIAVEASLTRAATVHRVP